MRLPLFCKLISTSSFFNCVKKLGWVYTFPFEESKEKFSEQGSQVMPQNGYLRKQEQLKSECSLPRIQNDL